MNKLLTLVVDDGRLPGNLREVRTVLEYDAAGCIRPVLCPRISRESAEASPSPGARLAAVLGEWLDARLAEKATYRHMHDAIESVALRHLLAHFEGKPTVLAREIKMNRVTLRSKLRRQ